MSRVSSSDISLSARWSEGRSLMNRRLVGVEAMKYRARRSIDPQHGRGRTWPSVSSFAAKTGGRLPRISAGGIVRSKQSVVLAGIAQAVMAPAFAAGEAEESRRESEVTEVMQVTAGRIAEPWLS